MYSFESEIRYSELDSDGKLSIDKILDYFQDCSYKHSESLSLGMDFLKEQKRAWILSSWQVIVKRYPLQKEKILIGTWPYGFKGYFGYRNFVLKDLTGEVIALANSTWILIDLNTNKPIKVHQEMIEKYEMSNGLDMDISTQKIKIPDNMETMKEFSVKKYHLDTNKHVNNAKYISFAQEYLPMDFDIKKMRAEYRKSAVYEDIIYPSVGMNQGIATIVLSDKNGKIFSVIELEGDK